MEEKNIAERINDAFRSNFGYIAVILVSLAYVSMAFLTIGYTGKSVLQIIAEGVITFLFGIVINRSFEMQGMIRGDSDQRVIKAVADHAGMVESIAHKLDELDEWCAKKNAEALARARRTYLSRNGMRYKDYFTDEGLPLPFVPVEYKRRKERRAEWWRQKHFEHAVNIKITRLSAGLLISDTGDPADPYFLGRSKKEYEAQSMKKDVWSKIVLAVFFGYYGVSLVQEFSPANLIWTIFQLALFIFIGSVRMEQCLMFVTDEYRDRVTKKTNILRMFQADNRKENGNAE